MQIIAFNGLTTEEFMGGLVLILFYFILDDLLLSLLAPTIRKFHLYVFSQQTTEPRKPYWIYLVTQLNGSGLDKSLSSWIVVEFAPPTCKICCVLFFVLRILCWHIVRAQLTLNWILCPRRYFWVATAPQCLAAILRRRYPACFTEDWIQARGLSNCFRGMPAVDIAGWILRFKSRF